MDLLLVDHLAFALLAVVLPLHGWWAYRQFLRRVAGDSFVRAAQYRHTAGWLWGVFVAIAALWIVTGRAPALLGVRAPAGPGFAIGVGVLGVIVTFFARQLRFTKRSAAARDRVVTALCDVAPLLPHTLAERRWFSALALTAGIVEELAYRGFLIWYVSQLTGLWPAVVLSSIVFGVGHAYQGLAGMAKTGVAGLVMALLYVLTGSIWLSMILHWAVDDIQGRTAFAAFSGSNAQPVELPA